MTTLHWYKSIVLKGQRLGQKLGFPTINLDPKILLPDFLEGVYACKVRFQDKTYLGALFYGPRLVLGESHRVLEINIFDFDKNIYGEEIKFKPGKFIRKPANFASLEDLKKQLCKDVEDVQTFGKFPR